MLRHMLGHADIFVCPSCRGDLKIDEDRIECLKCHHYYQFQDDIPLLFLPGHAGMDKKDVEPAVKSFYEGAPFPNYEEFENTGDLLRKAGKNFFARLLNEQLPFNIRVLEVGCGTGQLSNFLGVAQRVIFATDMSISSLKLGQDFRKRNNLERVGFYQMNLFRPIFREESFPFVICNGVLHHTGNPFAGFKAISRLVQKGGYILVGLYNRYGRITTDIRRIIFKISNDRFKFLDPRLRGNERSDLRKEIWFRDQYKNPHESRHTIGELLKWFEQTGFDFVNAIPKLSAFEPFSDNEQLFKPNPRGGWFDHFIAQACMVFTGNKEGEVFLMVGRKRF